MTSNTPPQFGTLIQKLHRALGVPGLKIPAAAVKIFSQSDEIPAEIKEYQPQGMTVTACHALRSTTLGEPVYLNAENIGCIAAAVTLGLVDQNRSKQLPGPRVYTEIMRKSSGKGDAFVPPTPAEFSDGSVYACKDAGRDEFSLFGREDTGRYKTKAIARKALSEMLSIQPPTTQGLFCYGPEFTAVGFDPDVVILSVRPVEMCRLIQGFQFLTGERVRADIGGVRAGCSDLIVRPLLTQEINLSPFCLGARLIAKFEADRMGLGMPYDMFRTTVAGVAESVPGFPFEKYPGA